MPELIWGSLAFLIVLGVLVKFAFPTLKKTLQDRQDKIREDLEGAETAKAEAERERDDYRAEDPGLAPGSGRDPRSRAW